MMTLREINARCMREARLGQTSFTWERMTDSGRELELFVSDCHLRALERNGVRLCAVEGHEPLPKHKCSPVIYSGQMTGRSAMRLVRKGRDDLWEIVSEESGKQIVQLSFDETKAIELGSRVLTGDASVKNEPGAMTILAAWNEVLRTGCVGMEAQG